MKNDEGRALAARPSSLSRSRISPRVGTTATALRPSVVAKLDDAVGQREQGVVLGLAYVVAGMKLRAALANDDGTRADLRSAEHLHAEALCVGVTAVPCGTATLCL